MTGRVLLDSNAVIALLAHDEGLELEILDADDVFVSTTVLGELYFGAARSTRVEENTAAIDRFADTCPVLLCTRSAARTYGQIKAGLKAAGKPIPENDIWIAAVAVENDLALVSRDGHFRNIDGLKVLTW